MWVGGRGGKGGVSTLLTLARHQSAVQAHNNKVDVKWDLAVRTIEPIYL